MHSSWLLFIFLFSSLLSRLPPMERGVQGVMPGAGKGLEGLQGVQHCLAGVVQAAHKRP